MKVKNSKIVFMKFIRYSLLLITCIYLCAGCNAQRRMTKATAMYEKLMQMNFKEYENKEVKVFFSDFGYDYIKCIPTAKKPGFISHVIFRYNDSLSVDIAVKDLGQKEPLNFNYKFDIGDFKTKKIDWVCFRYGGRCIKGCE